MLRNLKQFNLPEIEKKVLDFWKENNTFEESLRKREKGKKFVFYEGPPTANGHPGIHHVLARAFKDIIARYKTMRGFFAPRRAGWDTHGLPVEIQVEKELGFNSKKDIEKFGIEKFNQKCRESVWKYKKEWEELTQRMGYWLDLKHPYITYETKYIETLWWIIKQFWEKGLLYKGHKIVPWCIRCGTALSSHEVAQGYETISEKAVFVRFKVKAKTAEWENTSIFSWTTTPWTLPGNVALAVNPKHKFVCVPDPEKDGRWLVLEFNSFQRLLQTGIFPPEIQEKIKDRKNFDVFSGKELLGLRYEPLFKVKKLTGRKSYKIYSADFVSTGEGTGVVHTAVMYGEDDYELGIKAGLPQYHTVDEEGRFTSDVPELAGLYIKAAETEDKILKHLKERGSLLKAETAAHEYPFCWRCHKPLVYYARDAWFVAATKFKKELIKNNAKINWIPAHMKKGRFGGWLEGLKDWNFSRERFWGTPIPLWQCDRCRSFAAIGSLSELEQMSWSKKEFDKLRDKKGEIDLHRPQIDAFYLRCPKCKGRMTRIKELADVWFDSGAMPFAQANFPFAIKDFGDSIKKIDFPADYIAEAVDQTRGWFYTLLAIATLLGLKAPYKNVISLGHILDRSGRKMSKSLGNIIDPWEMMDRYGADAVRWHFYTINPPGETKRFDENDLKKVLSRFFLLLYNSFVFFETYAKKNLNPIPQTLIPGNILDRWILAKLNEVVLEATKRLDKYDIGGAAKEIEGLVDDLSKWYIRRSRRRFQYSENKKDYKEVSLTLSCVLQQVSKLIAPFAPFTAEALFQSFRKEKSVHLENWPEPDEKFLEAELIEEMAAVRRLASRALAERAKLGIKTRQVLNELRIGKEEFQNRKQLFDLLKEEVNVKKITEKQELNKEEMELDAKITPELKKEGLLRELTRFVQHLRQEAGCKPKDRICLFLEAPGYLKKTVNESASQLKKETGAKTIEFKRTDKFDAEAETNLGEDKFWVGIRKLRN